MIPPLRNFDTPCEATIVAYKKEAALDSRVASLAGFLGIGCRTICFSEAGHLAEFLSRKEGPTCVLVSASSLAAILRDETIPREAVSKAFDLPAFVLVYGITPDEEERHAVERVTHGLISSVRRFNESDHAYQVSAEAREITGEFAGLHFGPIKNDIDYAVVTSRLDPGFSALVTIDGLPFFASMKTPHRSLYLLACGDIADLHAEADTSLPARKYFSRVVPVMMFLRQAFGEQAWHNPGRRANFIIDDPLLRKSYGFLNYPQLLSEMDRSEFSSTIAFIPWNYRRTSPAIARLVKERPDRFSVCVHGCDHTGGEFSSTDVANLDYRAGLAKMRMQAHEQETGVPCDDVMVFPQGRFSSVSLSVLKTHNYLAAVNSSVKPQDLGDAHGLTLAEMIEPAISRYGNFPLFMRRYPRDVVDCAFDLFLGKPALLVEHHGYFQDGYEKIREFMTQLNALSPDLRWMGLGQLLSQTYLQRSTSPSTVECRIFVNHQVINNPTNRSKMFIISKLEDDKTSIKEVTVDGRQHPYVFENAFMKLSVDIPAFGASTIRISYADRSQQGRNNHRSSVIREVKVYFRRHLSEVRDNYLAKHPKVLALAYRVKNGKSGE